VAAQAGAFSSVSVLLIEPSVWWPYTTISRLGSRSKLSSPLRSTSTDELRSSSRSSQLYCGSSTLPIERPPSATVSIETIRTPRFVKP
jgi:hypothetical protein